MLAGIGRAAITPETPVMLAGFGGRHEPATEVHDELEVRTLYLADSSGGAGVCLIVCDLLGMSPSFALPVRQSVALDLGLPLSAVLTASTHTHSGPSCIAGSEAVGWPTPPGYAEVLVAGCRAAASQARHAAEPACLAYRRAPLPGGLSVNRRGLPYAPWLALLDIRSDLDERIGVLANLAVHPVALGPECLAVSADWVAPFRGSLETSLGGTAVMLSGALGDVNPRHVHRQYNTCAADGFAEANELGLELADAVATEVAAAEPLEDAIEVLRCERLEAPVGDTLLAQLQGSATTSVELIEWSLGGVRVVSVPGEAFHAFGRAIETSRQAPVLLAGLAPVWLGYLPAPFGEGYEESMSFGEPFVNTLLRALAEPPEQAVAES
ncbi:MAG: hypothetical protein ACLPTB_01665 [Acidimicrobiales bacterium]|jgi:hypothetical protein